MRKFLYWQCEHGIKIVYCLTAKAGPSDFTTDEKIWLSQNLQSIDNTFYFQVQPTSLDSVGR